MDFPPGERRLSEWLRAIPGRLASDTAVLDSQVLLAYVLNKPRAWVLAHPEAELSNEEEQRLAAALARLQAGEPLPYVLGRWEFFGLDFQVTPDVLIPRPETELVVELALAWLRQNPAARVAADVGTGTGCIAVSLAAQILDLHIMATDISEPALDVARQNAQKHRVDGRIDFIRADLLGLLNVEYSLYKEQRTRFHLITANLPYIPTGKLHKLPIYQKEPTLALDGGPDGLTLIRRLLDQAVAYLEPYGLILLEIEQCQGAAALELSQQFFPQAQVSVINDLIGYNRVIQIAKTK